MLTGVNFGMINHCPDRLTPRWPPKQPSKVGYVESK